MKLTTNTNIAHFKFWSGAVDNAKLLSYTELNRLDDILEDIYTEGLSETELNDLFWFDFELVCEWLDLDYDEVIER